MQYLIFVLSITLSAALTSDRAFAEGCEAKISREEFKTLVDTTRTLHFPELKNERIIITDYHSKSYFLQAQPNRKSLLRGRNRRVYEIQVNPDLLDCPPSKSALISILTHELHHIVDYTRMSTGQILKHGLKYLLNRNFRTRYERATDLKTLHNGEGLGLIQYREWIYPRLSSRQLALKQRYYLTPDEILALIEPVR